MLDTLAPPHDPTAPKPVWQSKSFWLGVVLTAVGITTYFTDPIHTPTMTVASISEAAGGVLAIVLRVWFTAAPIAGTGLAAQAEVAKQDIALHAALTTAPAAPVSVPLTAQDFAKQIEQMKQERDRMTALLNEVAALAAAPGTVPPP